MTAICTKRSVATVAIFCEYTVCVRKHSVYKQSNIVKKKTFCSKIDKFDKKITPISLPLLIKYNTMVKRSLLVFGIFLAWMVSFSKPAWKRINHISSTIFTASIFVDGNAAPKEAYVGAFYGGECRMVAPIIMNNDTAYVSSVIHGDVPEDMQFKIWLSEEKELDCKKTIKTKPGESILMENLEF